MAVEEISVEDISGPASPDPAALPETDPHRVLDRVTWAALSGPHARFAERHGRAIRYQPDIAPFAALEDPDDEGCWADAADLVGPAGSVVLLPGPTGAPAGWRQVFGGQVSLFVDTRVDAQPDPEAIVLGPDDVPEILDLVERTKPGPFLPRTIELGRYLGIRRDGALIAMAGERQQPPGWTEVSAVCTDPAYRGQGLAARLIRAVVAGVNERGDRAFLNVLSQNASAIRVYESLGFTPHTHGWVTALQRL
ncbi:MAG TPA: GNAT family N-acetyltransferase [Actinocrinis sp.]|nr:GNAT family N-acetyltransferase [Actinocrinis sp.]